MIVNNLKNNELHNCIHILHRRKLRGICSEIEMKITFFVEMAFHKVKYMFMDSFQNMNTHRGIVYNGSC